MPSGSPRTLDRTGLDDLIQRLAGDGYDVIGPRVSGEAIIWDRVGSTRDR